MSLWECICNITGPFLKQVSYRLFMQFLKIYGSLYLTNVTKVCLPPGKTSQNIHTYLVNLAIKFGSKK